MHTSTKFLITVFCPVLPCPALPCPAPHCLALHRTALRRRCAGEVQAEVDQANSTLAYREQEREAALESERQRYAWEHMYAEAARM